MSYNKVGICNSALAKVGARPITSLDDDSEPARLCKAQYDTLKKDFLRGHLWNFAIKRTDLAQDATTPEYDFSYRYRLPSDCLRVVGTNLPDTAEWVQEGDFILTSYSTLKIKYLADVDEYLFDANAAEALAYMIAEDLSYALTQSNTLVDRIGKKALDKLRSARSYDAQVGSVQRIIADQYIDIRR